MKPSFAQIETLPLAERMSIVIQEAIMRGEIRPGEKIQTYNLARQFNVSHIPVREALKKLETLGLIVLEANRGARVVELDKEDFDHIQAVRISLERLVIPLAVPRMNAAARKNLQTAVTTMRRAADSKDFVTLVDADKRFHEIIWELTGNRHLVKALKHLLLPYFGFLVSKASYRLKDLGEVPRTHQELLDALSAGDTGSAQEILTGMHSSLATRFSFL